MSLLLQVRRLRKVVNILVVDDQPYVGEILTEEFSHEGYRFSSVSDVNEVWNQLRDSQTDLVLLDLYLEEYMGWEVLHAIKKQHPDLPVLILSAYDTFSEDPRLSQADGYVVKSFSDFDKLKQTIADILQKKEVL
jgi:CheY-like chemotaxis protein